MAHSVSDCKTFIAPGSASAEWLCFLELPDSITVGDGRRIEVTGVGNTKEEASELACCRAVAVLLMTCPEDVRLVTSHWRILPHELVAGLPGTNTVHQALPVHVGARSQNAGVDITMLTADEWYQRVYDLICR